MDSQHVFNIIIGVIVAINLGMMSFFARDWFNFRTNPPYMPRPDCSSLHNRVEKMLEKHDEKLNEILDELRGR